jgi:hypothetical protein
MECEILNIKKAITITPSLLTGVPSLFLRLPHSHLSQPSPPAPPAPLAELRTPVHFEFSNPPRPPHLPHPAPLPWFRAVPSPVLPALPLSPPSTLSTLFTSLSACPARPASSASTLAAAPTPTAPSAGQNSRISPSLAPPASASYTPVLLLPTHPYSLPLY